MLQNNYDYFSHDADIGIIGRGSTLENAFIQAARAVFAYMVNLNEVQPKKIIRIEFIEDDNEFALIEWLNALLGEARQSGMIFSQFTLRRENNHWQGTAQGESWRESLERGTEVKGATLTMLSVTQHNSQWQACCVVDV